MLSDVNPLFLPHHTPSPLPNPAAAATLQSHAIESHLLPINTPIIRLQHHKPLARDMQPGTLHLLDSIGALVLVRRDDLLHFLRLDGEARRRGPHAVAFVVEDGRFVDVAGADEAVEAEELVSPWMVGVVGKGEREGG